MSKNTNKRVKSVRKDEPAMNTAMKIFLAGCVAALCMQGGMRPLAASAIGLLTGLVCGFLNGFFIAKLRVPFFIMTAGMMYAASGLALVLTHETSIGIKEQEGVLFSFTLWGAKTIGIIPTQFLVALFFFVLLSPHNFFYGGCGGEI